jgi:hypothetical protein
MPQGLPWRKFMDLLRQRAKDYLRQTTRGQAHARNAWDGKNTLGGTHLVHPWEDGYRRFPTPPVECLCV